MENQNKYPCRVNLLGVDIDPFTMQQTVDRTDDLISSGCFAHLIGVNADKVLQIRNSDEMHDCVSRCEIVNADGASMLIAAERLGVEIPERVAGIDLMHELCKLCQRRGYSVYLLGAKTEVVEKTREVLEETYPGINICGIHDGYFTDSQYDEIAEMLMRVEPQVVFVGITSPKKERLIEHLRERGLKGVYVGVGGSFDVVSGSIPRAPKWMQQVRLEWLFRMMQEPKRLAKRYIVGNARFMRLVSAERRMRKKGAGK